MISELIDKYIWLVQTFIDAGDNGLLIEDVVRKWEQRYGEVYNRRTFNNHRLAVAESFGIEIECDRRTNRYLIRYGKDAIDSESSIKWLINTFTVNNLLSLGKERLSGRVAVEDIPSGQMHLTGIMTAMLECKQLEIEYQKYVSIEAETLHVDPYAVKEYEKRWYIIGWCHERNALRVYSLDRIISIYETQMTFHMPEDFDVAELFKESFGTYIAQPEEVRVVRFKAVGKQAKYLHDLPIHPSQREIERDGDSVTFLVRTAPNDAFYMELMKYGNRIEIISPEEVRDHLREELEKAISLYNK